MMKTLTFIRIEGVCCLSALITTLLCAAIAGRASQELPPLPKGVTELKFSEFFVSPVGPRGLELTDKLKALDGKRVRILGYMVRQEHAVSGTFLLTPLPVQLHDHDSALADDLPASAVRVIAPDCPDQQISYTPQLLLLAGTLSIGNREGPDGRIATVTLWLDQQRRRAKAVPFRRGASPR